jgi:hypothetical protein
MKTIARVHDTYGQACRVVADLESSGIKASSINLIEWTAICRLIQRNGARSILARAGHDSIRRPRLIGRPRPRSTG